MSDTVKLKRKKEGKFFKGFKSFMKLGRKKVRFVYTGEKFEEGALILSNHESTKGPLSWDFYCDKPVRLLGTEEMNSGLRRMYKYQSEVYYHDKKHWNIVLAKLFCLLASPTTNLFYKGLDLISVRDGLRFRETMADACTSLIDYKENLVIFPEDSETGYHKRLVGFKKGFLMIAREAYKRGYDVPIVVSYYNRYRNLIVVGEPIKYSTLQDKFTSKDEIASYLLDICNNLGEMSETL